MCCSYFQFYDQNQAKFWQNYYGEIFIDQTQSTSKIGFRAFKNGSERLPEEFSHLLTKTHTQLPPEYSLIRVSFDISYIIISVSSSAFKFAFSHNILLLLVPMKSRGSRLTTFSKDPLQSIHVHQILAGSAWAYYLSRKKKLSKLV